MHYVFTAIAILIEQGWMYGPVPPPASAFAEAQASAPAAVVTSEVREAAVERARRPVVAPATPVATVVEPSPAAEPLAAEPVFEVGPLIDVPVPAALLAQGAPQVTAGKLTAAGVVAKVQEFYLTTNRLTADFRQYYTNTTFGKKTKSDGRVYIKKPGKMRWDYHAKSRGKTKQVKSFVSDGALLWAVEHDNKQAFKQELGDNVLPVAVTFLHGTGNLNKDFDARLDTSGKHGKKGDLVLELTPKKPSAQYKTLWLVVDPGNFRVKESVVLEASGNTNRFAFYRPNLDKPIKDSWFAVDEAALKKARYRIIEPDKQK